nr:gamma-tubulin complex component 2 [Cryptomonas curvata]
MVFNKFRELYGNNFFKNKKEKLEKNNNFKCVRVFLILEKLFYNLKNFNSCLFFECIPKSSKNKKTLQKLINFIIKINKIFNFIKIYKNQKYISNISILCNSFKIMINEFKKIITRLYIGIYDGWISLSIVWYNLFPSSVFIEMCYILIKKLIKKNFNFIFLKNYIVLKKNKKTYYHKNQLYCLVKYFLNFKFYCLINKSISCGIFDDPIGNFMNIFRLRIKGRYKYQIILKKSLSILHKKIIKFIVIISFLLKNTSNLTKKVNFEKTIKNKFICKNNFYENNLILFLKNFYLKISKLIFLFLNESFIIFNYIRDFLFFFCFLNCKSWEFIKTNEKIEILKKRISTDSKKFSHSNIFGCFTIDFIDYTYNKLIGFIYFENFFKKKNNKYYSSVNNFSNPYNSDKVILNCSLRWPLLCFISKNSIQKYQMLGKYLFKIKFIENTLIKIWKIQKSAFYFSFFGIIRASLFLNHKILSFFKCLLSHCFFSVLEFNWKLFAQQIYKSNNIDIIMVLHEKFLGDCINEFYLIKPKISRIITRIYAIGKLFSIYIKKILTKSHYFPDIINYSENKRNIIFKNFQNKLLIFKKSFNIEIEKLIKNLFFENKKSNKTNSFEKFLNTNQFFTTKSY